MQPKRTDFVETDGISLVSHSDGVGVRENDP